MTTTTQPAADDLRAALLTACAAAGHPATLDARGERLIFDADGATVPVKIEGAARASYGSKATPPTIVLARLSPHARRFRPLSGLFDWPLVARTAIDIAAALRVEAERAARRAARARAAMAEANRINDSLGLTSGAAVRADARGGGLLLAMGAGCVEATEEQIRVMVAAARACGLVAAGESGEEQTV